MTDQKLQHAGELKQALVDFVYDAEGELAVALERYSAARLTRPQSPSMSQPLNQSMNQKDLLIELFLLEGEVTGENPIELFIQSHPKLSEGDRQMLQNWRSGFVGLFAITQILEDGFELMNWMTEKRYITKPTSAEDLETMQRLKSGEIILTQIAPVEADLWMFFSPWIQLGKLGKPKLAVAIGNFKENYRRYLYSDAPDLLEQSWQSVGEYHQKFKLFFGSDELTLSGYELSKKLTEFQDEMIQEQLAAAQIDPSKSLDEMAEEAGISQEELEESMQELGAEPEAIAQLFNGKNNGKTNGKTATKMVTPKAELPPHLKKAERVTVITHPRWGQMLLPDHWKIQQILEEKTWKDDNNTGKLIQKYLEDPQINAYIWHLLAERYPDTLEAALAEILEQPNFKLQHDLDELLTKHHKPLEPELPDIASAPIHLHNLFQEAIQELNKSKSKSKNKKKKSVAGFQR